MLGSGSRPINSSNWKQFQFRTYGRETALVSGVQYIFRSQLQLETVVITCRWMLPFLHYLSEAECRGNVCKSAKKLRAKYATLKWARAPTCDATMTPNPRQSTQNVTARKKCRILSEICLFDGDLGGLGELITVYSAGISDSQ